MRKILIIDDEPTLVDAVSCQLVQDGYFVTATTNGENGLELFSREYPDLVILDPTLPDMDGMTVLQRIRSDSYTPVVIITSKKTDLDCVLGLELGAEDYITKPFSLRELSSRIKSILRRLGYNTPTPLNELSSINVGDIHIDLMGHEARLDGKHLELSAKEYEILKFLAFQVGQVVSRQMLLERVWGTGFKGGERTVDVHIRWLREKLESDPSNPRYILTIYGSGYKLSRYGT